MGTINYNKSDYITMGINPGKVWDIQNDPEVIAEVKESIKPYGGTFENAMNEYIENIFAESFDEIEAILNKYSFYYYHIALKPGYYEGFYLDIENNFCICYDTWQDKREAQKEITQIKKLLHELTAAGLVACFPGWCTGYATPNETRAAIDKAIKEMRGEAEFTPTWLVYNRFEFPFR